MIDRKPYLVRAIYEWIVDNGWTPHIVVDTTTNEVAIPEGYDQDGFIILNIAPTAVQGLHIENDNVTFSARFGGIACSISFPIASVAGVYARENNEGLQLSVTSVSDVDESAAVPAPSVVAEPDESGDAQPAEEVAEPVAEAPKPSKAGRPKLTVVGKADPDSAGE